MYICSGSGSLPVWRHLLLRCRIANRSSCPSRPTANSSIACRKFHDKPHHYSTDTIRRNTASLASCYHSIPKKPSRHTLPHRTMICRNHSYVSLPRLPFDPHKNADRLCHLRNNDNINTLSRNVRWRAYWKTKYLSPLLFRYYSVSSH